MSLELEGHFVDDPGDTFKFRAFSGNWDFVFFNELTIQSIFGKLDFAFFNEIKTL